MLAGGQLSMISSRAEQMLVVVILLVFLCTVNSAPFRVLHACPYQRMYSSTSLQVYHRIDRYASLHLDAQRDAVHLLHRGVFFGA